METNDATNDNGRFSYISEANRQVQRMHSNDNYSAAMHMTESCSLNHLLFENFLFIDHKRRKIMAKRQVGGQIHENN